MKELLAKFLLLIIRIGDKLFGEPPMTNYDIDNYLDSIKTERKVKQS